VNASEIQEWLTAALYWPMKKTISTSYLKSLKKTLLVGNSAQAKKVIVLMCDTNALKKFAQAARKPAGLDSGDLQSSIWFWSIGSDLRGREHPQGNEGISMRQCAREGSQQSLSKAYIWFNRFHRRFAFMDAK